MTFVFRTKTGDTCDPVAWATEWEHEYPVLPNDQKYYDLLIQKAGKLSSDDFVLIGKWKDDAWSEGRWKPNVAMVAFPAWITASEQLPGFVLNRETLEGFLLKWAEHLYPDASARSIDKMKRFGLARATTIAHFLSAGDFPICDSRVRKAIKRLCSIRTPDEVGWYLQTYMPIFEELKVLCRASARKLDKVLYAYGGS